jgi:hypothetical protein
MYLRFAQIPMGIAFYTTLFQGSHAGPIFDKDKLFGALEARQAQLDNVQGVTVTIARRAVVTETVIPLASKPAPITETVIPLASSSSQLFPDVVQYTVIALPE